MTEKDDVDEVVSDSEPVDAPIDRPIVAPEEQIVAPVQPVTPDVPSVAPEAPAAPDKPVDPMKGMIKVSYIKRPSKYQAPGKLSEAEKRYRRKAAREVTRKKNRAWNKDQLELMTWILENPAKEDKTEGEKQCRLWLERDVRGWWAAKTALETRRKELVEEKKEASKDRGVAEALVLLERLLEKKGWK